MVMWYFKGRGKMMSKLDSIKRKVSFTFVCRGVESKNEDKFYLKKGGRKEDDEKKTETFFHSLSLSLSLFSARSLHRSFCFFQE